MATYVNSAFNEFNTNTVNLDPTRTNKAISSRDWLFSQLNNLDGKEDLNFPFKYEEKNIKYGSFARKTKIRELDDVDIMFCMTGDGATYLKNQNVYTIYTPNAGQRLKNLSDNGILNSKRIVNKLKTSLSNIPHYNEADLHSKGEAVTLNLQSYEWVFDIVPCFYTDTELYLIPDTNGNWKATDPRIDQNLVSTTNQNCDGKALQLIRILKYWNRHNSSYTISSYLYEQIILNFINSKNELNQWIDFNIKDFFNYLSTNIHYTVNDPKGIQGNLNNLTYLERQSISQKAAWAFDRSKEAIYFETTEKNQEKSINKWREIFGNKFPSYE
ncbi:SMODS domain-containing nucleotidyltransferase [Flavobacterium sp. PS2]|uniref:SMODS domain-containing nucleotidyltransferase n=1 Tax=Flavobacterium sp. PS2 TaxID=3384157 RepID=UPI00390C45CD